jgi:hypothetical protein
MSHQSPTAILDAWPELRTAALAAIAGRTLDDEIAAEVALAVAAFHVANPEHALYPDVAREPNFADFAWAA